jgi:hypothetical protein
MAKHVSDPIQFFGGEGTALSASHRLSSDDELAMLVRLRSKATAGS